MVSGSDHLFILNPEAKEMMVDEAGISFPVDEVTGEQRGDGVEALLRPPCTARSGRQGCEQ